MSDSKRDYDVMKGLINNKQVYTLSSEQVLACVQARTCEQLGGAEVYYVLHDGCVSANPIAKRWSTLARCCRYPNR